jgi:hypothetical protein
MARRLVLVGAGFLTVLLLVPTHGFSQDLFGWSLSASNTQPDVNTAPPTPGVFSIYLWLACTVSDAVSAVAFHPTGTLQVLAFTPASPPDVAIWNVGECGDLVLAICGCPEAPLLVGEILVLDPVGIGGTLCLGDASCTGSGTVNCSRSATAHSYAVVGFASDGSQPCIIGSCDPVVSASEDRELTTWGRVKAIYR